MHCQTTADAPRTAPAAKITIWPHVEPNASLIAACSPTLAPLARTEVVHSLSSRMRTIFSPKVWVPGSRDIPSHVQVRRFGDDNAASHELPYEGNRCDNGRVEK